MLLLLCAALAQVATVNGEPIPEEAFREKVRWVRELDDAGRMEAVDRLVEWELLAQAARAEGFEADPRVQELLVKLLLKEQVYASVRNSDFTDEQLRAWYLEHQAEYLVPAKRQLRVLTLETRQQADALLVELSLDPSRFGELAREHSVDAHRSRGGDVGFVSDAGKPGLDPALAALAFQAAPGQVLGPVRLDQGWVLYLVGEERPAVQRTYIQMKGTVLREVKEQHLEELRLAYLDQLAAASDIRVDRDWLRHNAAPRWGRPQRRLGAIATLDGVPVVVEGESLEDALADALLLREAHRRGLLEDPRVEKAMVNAYLRARVYSQVRAEDIGEEELRLWFEAHREELMVPEQVQVKTVTLFFGVERTRDEARLLAEQVMEEVPRRPLVDIAAEYSEDPYKRRAGDAGFTSREGKPGLPQEVVEAAFAQRDGDFTLVELEDRFVIVVTASRRPRVERTYEQVHGTVLRRVRNERMAAVYEAHVAALREQAQIEVDAELVLSMPIEPARPAPPPSEEP